MDVLDKLAACSAEMGKNEAAIGFAAAAIHLDPKSPVVCMSYDTIDKNHVDID